MNKELEAKRDFMKDNINEVMLVDTRAKRLLTYILNKLGLSKTLDDPRIEAFVMSLNEEDEPDYDILTDIVMELKGYNVKPIEYLSNKKDRIFTKDEVIKVFPYLAKFINQLNDYKCKSSFLCGDGFRIELDGEYYKISNYDKRRMFIPIYVIR